MTWQSINRSKDKRLQRRRYWYANVNVNHFKRSLSVAAAAAAFFFLLWQSSIIIAFRRYYQSPALSARTRAPGYNRVYLYIYLLLCSRTPSERSHVFHARARDFHRLRKSRKGARYSIQMWARGCVLCIYFCCTRPLFLLITHTC